MKTTQTLRRRMTGRFGSGKEEVNEEMKGSRMRKGRNTQKKRRMRRSRR